VTFGLTGRLPLAKKTSVRIEPWRPSAWTALLICFGITGCSTASKAVPEYRIAIDSNPQGVRVEINNQYAGTTPLVYRTYGNADGTFRNIYVHDGYARLSSTPSIWCWSWPGVATPAMHRGYYEFVAKPSASQPDLYVQRKSFKTSYYFAKPDRIPEKIFFDLHQKPEQGKSAEVAVRHGFEP
jgi:PEGA domain